MIFHGSKKELLVRVSYYYYYCLFRVSEAVQSWLGVIFFLFFLFLDKQKRDFVEWNGSIIIISEGKSISVKMEKFSENSFYLLHGKK